MTFQDIPVGHRFTWGGKVWRKISATRAVTVWTATVMKFNRKEQVGEETK